MPTAVPPNSQKPVSSPSSPPLPADQARANAHDGIDIYRKDDQFDDRPQDPVSPPSLLDRLGDWITAAITQAKHRVMQVLRMDKLPSIRDGADFDAVQVSAPFNVKKLQREDFPSELREGLAQLEAKQAAEASRQAFVQGADLMPPPPEPGADEQAFGHYMTAWRQQRHQAGRVICPQNFVDGARRFAADLLDLQRQRRLTMENNYWLAPDDQMRVEAATALLLSDQDAATRALAREVTDAGPTQKNSIEQALSFYAWREWKRHPDKVPAREGFSLDAALAFAQLQVQTFASGDLLKDNHELRDLLADATDLIANQRRYDDQLDAAWMLASLAALREFDKQQDSARNNPVRQGAPVPSPASSAWPAPPARPARRESGQSSATAVSFAERMGLPTLDSLSPNDRMMAEETFAKFVEAFRLDMAGFKPDAKAAYLFPECVAVADDFAERILAAQDTSLSARQRDRLLAALRLRELYAQYRR